MRRRRIDMAKKIIIDNEFQSLIPPLTKEEYNGLEKDIITNGCRVALDVWDNIVIDGHNRYKICSDNNIPYKTNSLSFTNRVDVLLWIINNQLNRRNISPYDRVILIQKQETLVQSIKGKAKENLKIPTGGKKSLTLSKKTKSVDTRKELSKLAGVSPITYHKAVIISQDAKPEQIKEMREKKKSINAVYNEIQKDKENIKREQLRKKAAKSLKEMNSNIIIGDFRKKMDLVPDNSVSLIFTDPPYSNEAKKLFPYIAEFAKKKLISGGSILCYCGQLQLYSAMESFEKELRFWWTICCLHSGKKTLMREYGIRCHWKPILWYVKDKRENPQDIVIDIISGGQEKEEHEWQQAINEAIYWIEKLCPVNGIVCDMFLGSGTTALAAEQLKRKWIGFEKDIAVAKIANERINNDSKGI